MRDLKRPGLRRLGRRQRSGPRRGQVRRIGYLGGGRAAGDVGFGSGRPRRPRRLRLRLRRLGSLGNPAGRRAFLQRHLLLLGPRITKPGGRRHDRRRGRPPRGQRPRDRPPSLDLTHVGLPQFVRLRPGELRLGRSRPDLGRCLLRPLRPGLGRMGMPHPRGHQDLVLLREWCHPAPGPGLSDVPELRAHQLGQPLAFNDRPRRQPGEHTGRKYVKPYQVVVERQTDSNKEYHVWDRDPDEDSDPGDRQRCWQPKVVKLVKPFFDPPDICISGEIH